MTEETDTGRSTMFERAAAIDLGSSRISVFVRGKGIVLEEPSLAAVDRRSGTAAALGSAAEALLQRPDGTLSAVRPIRRGVIADGTSAALLLRRCLRLALGRTPFRPDLLLCVPSRTTAAEEKALRETAYQAGARSVRLIGAPLAAALGSGMDISGPDMLLSVDIGGGICDAARLSLGGIADAAVSEAGGERFDEALRRHLRRKLGLQIGERTAMELRHSIGCVLPRDEPAVCTVQGRDSASGFPKTCEIDSRDTLEAYEGVAREIAETVESLLERCAPQARAELALHGILLSGGGRLLVGLDRWLAERTGLPVSAAEDPRSCALRGAGSLLDRPEGGLTLLKRQPPRTARHEKFRRGETTAAEP